MRKIWAALACGGFVSASALILAYNTHAHMQQVRGDSYERIPLPERMKIVTATSWQRAGHLLRGDHAADETLLNRATYGLPCPAPIIK